MTPRTCVVDIETFSPVDLKKSNAYRYAADPEFRILMAGWTIDGKTYHLSVGQEETHRDLGKWLRDPDVLKVAHNAPFERICFSRLLGLPVGTYLPPEQWLDTAVLAAVAGLPRSLGKAAEALGVAEELTKDTAGTRLINLFSKPRAARWGGGRVLPEDKPEQWAEFCAYCVQDVRVTVELARQLPRLVPAEELALLVDQRINDRGVRVDLDLAAAAAEATQSNKLDHELEITALTGVVNPSSQPQLLGWLRESGLDVDDLRKETVTEALHSPDLTPTQRRVLELRQSLALTTSQKYSAALRSADDDGRLRGAFTFYGAHTGRWSGKGIQLHNLARDSVENSEAHIIDLKLGLGADDETLKALIRPMLLGPMVVVDYAQIEARVLAWLAGEQWVLAACRESDEDATRPDIYEATAEKMGGADRSTGKIATLALGYNGSVGSLRAMGYGGPPCIRDGAPTKNQNLRTGERTEDLRFGTVGAVRDHLTTQERKAAEAHKHRYPHHLCDYEMKPIVTAWRQANTQIVQLWGLLQDRFGSGGRAGDRLRVEKRGRDRRIVLPSGRALTYRNVGWERFRKHDEWTEGWRFDDPKGFRADTYGGRLAENVTQAVARDVLSEALVRLDAAGHAVLGHVHDEALVEGRDLHEVRRIMKEPPAWATGLPINANGAVTDRYGKL